MDLFCRVWQYYENVGTVSYDEDTNQIPSKCKSEGMQLELACCVRYAFVRYIVKCDLGLKQ